MSPPSVKPSDILYPDIGAFPIQFLLTNFIMQLHHSNLLAAKTRWVGAAP
jgi:hypothetical protein